MRKDVRKGSAGREDAAQSRPHDLLMEGRAREEDVPLWRIYERVAACLEVETAGMDVSVTSNASLVGSISCTARQIDILVDARWETSTERRIIFDAKRRKRKLTVQDVDAFVGLMSDVGASRGVLVCTNGWTEAAEARAVEAIELQTDDGRGGGRGRSLGDGDVPSLSNAQSQGERRDLLGRAVSAASWRLGDGFHWEVRRVQEFRILVLGLWREGGGSGWGGARMRL